MTLGSSFIAGDEFGGGKIEFWDFLAKSTFPWNGQKSLLLITYFIYSQCSSCARGWTDEDTKVVPSLKSICQSFHSLILLRFQTILNLIIFLQWNICTKKGEKVFNITRPTLVSIRFSCFASVAVLVMDDTVHAGDFLNCDFPLLLWLKFHIVLLVWQCGAQV